MNAQPDAPIAKYRENTAWRRQTVTLFEDRVDVHGSVTLSDEAEWSCPLVMLAPQFQRGRRRGGMFSVGLTLLGVWITVVTVLWQMSSLALDSPKAALFWALPVLFLTMTLIDVAKRPYVVVHSADGAPLFTIVKNYPDGKSFTRFTEQLLALIRNAHQRLATPTEAPFEEPDQNEPAPN